jgi:hypothetical protein
MTRFIHDQFAKDYLETLLTPYGTVQAPRRVTGEVRQIDVWFAPNLTLPSRLGILSQIATTPCILEPYRNPVSIDEICDCLLKLLEVRGELQRQARREDRSLQVSTIPHLWILTPTASSDLCAAFKATSEPNWHPGIYFLGSALRTAIIAIHQLSATPETLWLRILGRGTVQKQAIDELTALPVNDSLKQATLELLYNLQDNLNLESSQDEDDRELIMRLQPLYQQKQAQAIQQGERLVVENILKTRFGELDDTLQAIAEAALTLPPAEFTPLLMQLSQEELIARFM